MRSSATRYSPGTARSSTPGSASSSGCRPRRPPREPRHEARPDLEPLRVHAGRLHRVRGDPARLAAAAHALDVADQRARCHRGRGRHPPGRFAPSRPAGDDPGYDCDRRGDEQLRGRVHDHGSDAQDVPGERAEEAMNELMRSEYVIEIAYLAASALFVLSLKWMSS